MDQVKQEENHAKDQAIAQVESIRAMVARLKHAEECDDEECKEQGDTESRDAYHDAEAAREAIQEDPLEVLVRSGWTSNYSAEGMGIEEFQILLCTGGPAVRLVGDLDEHLMPSRVWVEHQDWGTPWIEYFPGSAALDDVLTYAQQFYFGN